MAKDLLWDFLQNLSKGERLLFRRSERDNTKHIILYDYLVQCSDYSEQEAVACLKDDISAKQFAYIKHTLLQKLIDAKAQHLKEEDKELQLLHDVMCIRALRQSQQYFLADRLLNKAVKQAKEADLQTVLQLLTEESLRLNLFNRQYKSFDQLENIIAQARPTLLNSNHIRTIQNLYLLVLNIRQRYWLDTSVVTQKFDLEAVDKGLSDLQKLVGINQHFTMLYHSTKAMLLFLRGQNHESIKSLKLVMNLFIKQKLDYRIDGEYFLDALNLYVDNCGLLGQIQAAQDFLFHTYTKQLKQHYTATTYEVIVFRYQLRIAHGKADYKSVEALLRQNEHYFTTWLNTVSSEMGFKLLMSVAISKFVLGQNSDALYYIQAQLHDLDKSVPEEFLFLVHTFAVLLAYEIGDERIFSSYYRSSILMLTKKIEDKTNGPLIVKMLHKAYYSKTNIRRKQALTQLLNVLEERKQNRLLSLLIMVFNVPLWVQSKLEGVSYVSLMQKRVTQKS